MKWFRVWHGSATDPKWRTVARRSGQPIAVVYAVWTFMLETASTSANRGTLDTWSDEVAADAFGLEQAQVCAIREAMQGLTLDETTVRHWEKFQPKREDDSAERVQRHRNAVKRDVTQSNAPDRDTDRDSEKKEVEAPKAPNSKGSRLSIEVIPDDWKQFCLSGRKDLDPDEVFRRFEDYWKAKPGKDGVKTDWYRTWRNWVRNEKPGTAKPASNTNTKPLFRSARTVDEVKEYLTSVGKQIPPDVESARHITSLPTFAKMIPIDWRSTCGG